jgi:hypothetical protein
MSSARQKNFDKVSVLEDTDVNMFDFILLLQSIANIVIPETTGTSCGAHACLGHKEWVSFNIINGENTITFEGTDAERDALTACKTLEELANMANSLGEARLRLQ